MMQLLLKNNAYQLCQRLADGQFHSGEDCAQQLGITRAAIHKLITKLSEAPYHLRIDRISGKGYRCVGGLDLLNQSQIETQLSNVAKHHLTDISLFPWLTSTNQFLIQEAANVPLTSQQNRLCFAEGQTAGRGRRGKTWHSPFARNLYFSLQWHFQQDLAALRGLSLVVGLALAETLTQLGVADVGLKWPNDVMVAGKKIGGILLEVAGDVAGPCTVVIGVGLNVNMTEAAEAEMIEQAWTDLTSVSPQPISRNLLAAMVASQIIHKLTVLNADTIPTFFTDWQCYDILAGQNIICTTAAGAQTGVAAGITADGELRFQTADGEQVLNSGEVSICRL